ncbi:fatty acid--CoA ligase [Mycolicibacterium grossiae]|uniref:Long-chain-fatty-acid--CoA ligase FadD13 n=1 Tax=Mycolicibacterium grossiae TaxID=1552759 RepID=A0A1E8Q968_9MYCO|nr:fatty acid--CoA ligase [Mycolicibacterium grossiae]OFJ55138.1 long-chain fatty acid--CoA ligase [Mycolicibacterium grossiae]QEM47868.1 fatty acid--CoA ligase [Mycolicibacterium grossiae]
MRSTMQDVPLTVTTILRHAQGVNGDRTVTSALGDGRYRTTSYRDLGDEVGRLANALRGLGITGDERVGTFLWNTTEHLAVYLAAPAMGAVLHTLNIRLAPEQIAFIANEAEDRVIVADASLLGLLAPVLPLLRTVRTVVLTGDGDPSALDAAGLTVLRYDELLGGQSPDHPWPTLDETDAAAMCYTSGTTGNPKGVVYSHRSTFLHTMATCTTNVLGVGVADRVLPIVPMFHANAWGLPYAALMAGADLLLPDRFTDAASLVHAIETHRPTLAAAVPAIWNDVATYLDREPGHDISSLRLISCGGSAVPVTLMRTFEERHGVLVQQAWGMTETSPVATVAAPMPDATGEERWRQRATQGRPTCGVEVRVVADDGTELPRDGTTVGEIEVRGPWITGGYHLGRDAEKFADGWLRTGDVGTVEAAGYVTLTDRAKDVIKSGGEWVSSVELENHLIGHPAVLEAAVVGVPDDRWQERPLAVVVLHDGASATPDELRDFLADRVVRWWLPERWTFVDHVPRTSVGKYDKKTIRARYADGAYEVVGP